LRGELRRLAAATLIQQRADLDPGGFQQAWWQHRHGSPRWSRTVDKPMIARPRACTS